MSSLVSLAQELFAQAKEIEAVLERNGIQQPSFDHDTLEELPEDAQKLRRELADTSHTIRQLARGARLSGLDIAFNVSLKVHYRPFNAAADIEGSGRISSSYVSYGSTS